MKRIYKHKVVAYSSKQMYQLVNDIRSYPKFIAMCEDSEILSESAQQIEATLKIKKGAIKLNFSTRNTLHPYESIDIRFTNGPFKTLQGHWKFNEKSPTSCLISLDLMFEFNNFIFDKAFNSILSNLADSMLDSFVSRAEKIYGQD